MSTKLFNTLPESEQKARREARSKAKQAREAKVNNTTAQDSQSDTTNGSTSGNSTISTITNQTVDVPSNLAPTFREIMAASKVETKKSADGDTWIRIVKPVRKVTLDNLHTIDSTVGALVDSGANIGLQGADMRMLHQEHASVAVVGPSDGIEPNMENLPIVSCGGVATNSRNEQVLVIMTSAASFGRGKSILSRVQIDLMGAKYRIALVPLEADRLLLHPMVMFSSSNFILG